MYPHNPPAPRRNAQSTSLGIRYDPAQFEHRAAGDSAPSVLPSPPQWMQGQPMLDRRTGEPLNMPAGKVSPRTGTVRQSATQTVFNDRGELNADSRRDAFGQIVYALDQAHRGAVQPMYPMPQPASAADLLRQRFGSGTYQNTPDPVEFQRRIAAAFQNPQSEQFAIIGQELLGPVKEVIDYEGWSRKVLLPRVVRQGEIVRYDKDVFVTAWVIGHDGETPESIQRGRYIWPDWREVTAFPVIPLKEIYESQYDILARIQDRARQSLEFQEDLGLIKLLETAATQVNDEIAISTLTIPTLELLKLEIERHRLVADKFLVNRQEITDLVTTHGALDAGPATADPVTQREFIMAGYIGNVLNCAIITSAGTNTFEAVPPGVVYCVAAPAYLGGFPIRVELFSEPVNQFQQGLPRRGWFWYELISQVIFNPKAVARGSK